MPEVLVAPERLKLVGVYVPHVEDGSCHECLVELLPGKIGRDLLLVLHEDDPVKDVEKIIKMEKIKIKGRNEDSGAFLR